MNPIVEVIRRERLRAGLSEKKLAGKCGLSENYIKQVESGKKVIQEEAAKKILKVLGVETDALVQGSHSDEPEPVRSNAMPLPSQEPHKGEARKTLEPNDQWTDALAHIIRRFPIEHLSTGKTVGYKEIPLIGKQVDGCQFEKLRFFQVPDRQMQHLRILPDDILMVCETEAIINGKLYVVEIGGHRLIRRLFKEQNGNITASAGEPDGISKRYQQGQIKVIGQCMKVEFHL